MRKGLMLFAACLLLLAYSQVGFSQIKSSTCDRACLEGLVEKYLDAAIAHDPKLLPIAPDYKFTENGQRLVLPDAPLRPGQTRPDPKTAEVYSTAWGCKEQLQSGLIHFVWRVRDRRFVAVDQERGLVFSFAFFDHALGKDRTFQTPDGRTVTHGPIQPNGWEIAELFRIEKGLIRRIEANMVSPPYGMNSGWSSWEDGLSSAARDVTGVK